MKKTASIIITAAVAFALAFTIFPVTDVNASNRNTEPTLPASQMVKANGNGDQSGNDGDQLDNGGLPDSGGQPSQGGDADSSSSSSSASDVDGTDDETTTTEEITTTTTTVPTRATTIVNTAGKGWSTPKGKKYASMTLCCNTDGTFFNLTSQAGQKLYGYDTLQGASAGKGYGYFTLYNRKNNHVVFVKVLLREMRVVKVSAPLPTNHSNEITYNGRNNTIVVANSTPTPKRLTVINADTLTVMYHKNLKIKGKVRGMSKKQRKKFKGVGAIAYNEKHNNYICLTRKTHDLLFLNASFKPYKRVKQKKKVKDMLFQGMDSYRDCIFVCQSFKGKKKYNIFTVYNMKGKFLARFTIPLGSPVRELETVFHDGNQFYAGFYSCYGARADQQNLGVQRLNSIYRINNL